MNKEIDEIIREYNASDENMKKAVEKEYKKAKQEYEKMLKQTNLRNHKREKKLKQEERERVLKEFEKLENKGLEVSDEVVGFYYKDWEEFKEAIKEGEKENE